MSTDHVRAELRFSKDIRLLAALRGTVEHFALRAGMDDAEQRDLAEAVEQAGAKGIQAIPPESMLDAVVESFADRLEVTLSAAGAGPNWNAVGGAARSDPRLRVEVRSERGVSSLRFIRYWPGHSAGQ